MRAPPPVAVCCGGGRGWRAVQAMLPALAAAAVVAWGLLHLGFSWVVVSSAAFAAGACVGAWCWRRAAPRAVQLAWDGRQWRLEGRAGTVGVMLDLGPFLLLRHRAEGGTVWVAATAAEAGAAWHGLRAAVYAHLPEPAAPPLGPRPAPPGPTE